MLIKKKRGAVTFLKMANTITVLVIILAAVTGQFAETGLFRRVLFTFHMPMFFLLCGISPIKHKGEGKAGWLNFVRQMALFFVIPYILWALIYSNFSYRHLIWVLYGSWNALDKAQTLSILWFLPCMFVARVLVEGVLSFIPKLPFGKRSGALIFGGLSLAIGVLLPKVGSLGYPWCLDIAFAATGFMLLGYSIRDVIERVAKKPLIVLGMFAVSAAGFLAGTVFRGEKLEMVLMRSGDYGNLLWFFLNALSGCLMVLCLSALLSRSWKKDGSVIDEQEETGLNRVTMGIFVIHMPLLQQVILPLMRLLPFPIPQGVLFLAGLVLTRIISGWIIKVSVRYVPQLFGIFPSEQRMLRDSGGGAKM